MNPAVLQLVVQLATLVPKIVSDINEGRAKSSVTSDDLAELLRLSAQTSTDILARNGVTLPLTKP